MDEKEMEKIIEEIKAMVPVNLVLHDLSDDELKIEIEKMVDQKIGNRFCTISQKININNSIFSTFRGYGILDSMLYNEDITEIMINGYDNIFIEEKGHLYKLDKTFENEKRLNDIIQKLVGQAGREVNDSMPICDAVLPDTGARINVVVPPIALCGSTVTIRKFSKEPMTMDKLIRFGSLSEDIAHFLEILVRAKYNIFISGGTGSGKTTFLNALSNYIPKDERIITIEDAAELQIVGIPNLVRLQSRNDNSSGSGLVSIRDLIKSSLRMRPERIIVGEVRGGEALDMLQAMNTGHDGSLSTGHANSTKDMMSRLETMVLQGSAGLPLPAIRNQIASALDIVVHLSRLRDKSRKTMEISEVIGVKENGEIELNPLYIFEEDPQLSTINKVVGHLKRTENKMKNTDKLRLAGYTEEF